MSDFSINIGLIFTVIAVSVWGIILVLPWQPWRTRESLNAANCCSDEPLNHITIVIPARNEAEVLPATLGALLSENRGLRIIVVDDNSSDATAVLVKGLGSDRIRLLSGEALPTGWTGKLWAQQQGINQVETSLTLLLDADIVVDPGTIDSLLALKHDSDARFVSLLAAPQMISFWERLLMPAFVYFFKMLYPFSLSNSTRSRVAAAAGGCILLETQLIRQIGGLNVLKGAVIDDCTLAKLVKLRGNRIWTGLSRSVRSQRPYQRLSDIWDMVARTAYTQLYYSVWLLALCTLLLLILFLVPVVGLFAANSVLQGLSVLALAVMLVTYLPCLRYYDCHGGWVITLPFAAAIYLAMTWSSAIRYWRGERTRWKGRVYKNDQIAGVDLADTNYD